MPTEQPLYIHAPGRELFAWLRRPAGAKLRQVGIVICKPYGHEALCAHRSIRVLAAAAAGLGAAVVSFDYAGTGDSDDVPPDANQLDVWAEDIVAAAAELRRRSGVSRVVLLGLRLGALLATLAAARMPESIEGLIAIAPVIQGSRYLRELRTASLAADSRDSLAPASAHHPTSIGELDALGATLARATLSELAAVDLQTRPAPSFSKALIIDRADMPTARPWGEHLQNSGVRTVYESLPGTVEMLMTGTTATSVVPDQIVAAVQRWLAQLHPASHPAPHVSTNAIDFGAPMVHLAGPSASALGLTERPVRLSVSATTLFGIITEPPSGERRRRGVILLNSGADHHIGPNRLYVSLARKWSAHGYVVLRLDLAGIGDSAPRPGHEANEVFPPDAMSDVAAALQYLRDRYRLREVTLAGVCSGAYHALRAAASGLSIDRVLLINPRNFNWRPSLKIDAGQMIEAVSSAAVLGRPISGRHWQQLLAGRINILRLIRIIRNRLQLEAAALVHRARDLLHLRTPTSLGEELEALDARGIGLVFVFSRGDGGERLLRLIAGPSLDRLGDRCRIHLIDTADHGFSRAASRMTLQRTLSQELFTRQARRA